MSRHPKPRSRPSVTARLRARLARRPGMKHLARFLDQLRYPARASAIRGLFDGSFVSWTLERRGVHPLLAVADADAATATVDPERSIRVAAAVDAGLGLLPLEPTCLRRSLTLIRELRRLELDATLHIGVRTVADEIEAHAWVQVADMVVNDDADITDRYVELAAGDLERLLPSFR